jgi:hypothetical protein
LSWRKTKEGGKAMTEKEMREIFKNEIRLEDVKLGAGIYEFHIDGEKSIGVSYENIDCDTPHMGYIFNIFVGDEYIDIPNDFADIYDAVKAVTDRWNEF